MRVVKILGRGLLALAIAATPFVLGQGTASADTADAADARSASITFQDFSSPPQNVLCRVYADVSFSTSRATLQAQVQIQGPFDSRCAASLQVQVGYEGDDGVQHAAVANANGYQTSVAVDHVAGDVHVSNRATFLSCNMPPGGCTLVVQTNPK